ncbi:MAG: hypothetical protein ACTSRI_21455, partial [Promethearchaeota archaeon]
MKNLQDEKEKYKIEVQKKKVEENVLKKLTYIDYLIKERRFETALKSLTDIQKEAQANELVD